MRGREGAPEDVGELLIEAANTHRGEGEVLLEDGLAALRLEAGEDDRRALRFGQLDRCLRREQPARHLARARRAALLERDRLQRADLEEQVGALELDGERLAAREVLALVPRQDALHERRAVERLRAGRLLLDDKVSLYRCA